MTPEEESAARSLYYGGCQGNRVEDVVGHAELPQGFKYLHQLRPLLTRLSKATQEFDQQTGNKVWDKIKPNRSVEKGIRQVYIEEPEHHANIEEFMRDKLSQEGSPHPPLLKILTQTLMGRVMPKRLFEDPELFELAKKKYRDDVAKYGRTVAISRATPSRW